MDRLRYILNSPLESRTENGVCPPLNGDIVFDHVTFGYEKEKPVLKDLVRERLFSRYIFLKNGELPGQVEVIVNEEGKRLC